MFGISYVCQGLTGKHEASHFIKKSFKVSGMACERRVLNHATSSNLHQEYQGAMVLVLYMTQWSLCRVKIIPIKNFKRYL